VPLQKLTTSLRYVQPLTTRLRDLLMQKLTTSLRYMLAIENVR
jgi:hypothetical protein